MLKIGDSFFILVIGVYVSILWIKMGIGIHWIVLLWVVSVALNNFHRR